MSDNVLSKADLIAAVAEGSGESKASVERVVKAMQDTIIGSVADGKTVRMTGFAVFEPKDRPARVVNNPQTRKPQQVPAKRVAKVRPLAHFADVVSGKKKLDD